MVAALLVAGLGLQGMALHEGIATLTDPTTTYAYWTRLPGDRALWLSKRPACRPALSPMVCQYEGRTDDPRLILKYYPPGAGPVEHAIRLPQR